MVGKCQYDLCKAKLIQLARTTNPTHHSNLSICNKIHFLAFFRPIIIILCHHQHITGIQFVFPIENLRPYTFIIYIGPFIGTANHNCLIHAVPLITGSKCIDQFLPRYYLYIGKSGNPNLGKRITFIFRNQFTKTGRIP